MKWVDAPKSEVKQAARLVIVYVMICMAVVGAICLIALLIKTMPWLLLAGIVVGLFLGFFEWLMEDD